jgi:hypothetical protein
MQQITDFLYHVKFQEHVRVKINPVNVGNQFVADLDAHGMGTPANGEYRFIVTRPVGKTHFLIIGFRFINAGNNARYHIEISGDNGNNQPFSVTILPDDPNLDVLFRFEVVQ